MQSPETKADIGCWVEGQRLLSPEAPWQAVEAQMARAPSLSGLRERAGQGATLQFFPGLLLPSKEKAKSHLPQNTSLHFVVCALLHRTRLSRRDDLVLDACFHQPLHWTHRFLFSSCPTSSLIFVASFRDASRRDPSPRPPSPKTPPASDSRATLPIHA